MVPIPELRYQSLNPIVPATFGAFNDGGGITFDEKQTVFLLDYLPSKLVPPEPVDPVLTGKIFGVEDVPGVDGGAVRAVVVSETRFEEATGQCLCRVGTLLSDRRRLSPMAR